jgi:hypothetical protein
VFGSAWIDGARAALEKLNLCGERLEVEIMDLDTDALSRSILTFGNDEIKSVAFD